MNFGLAPVGRRVARGSWSSDQANAYWTAHYPSYEPVFFESGTQALAVALQTVTNTKPHLKHIYLPAYGCPTTLAASLFAGFDPILIDTAADQWGFDLAQLEQRLREEPGVILAIDLLGLGDQYPELQTLANATDSVVIQDCAQFVAYSEANDMNADMVIWSFGRGKPINLLGGGALMIRKNSLSEINASPVRKDLPRRWRSRFMPVLFDLATHPRIYPWLVALAGNRIGETHFEVLNEIQQLPDDALCRVVAGLASREDLTTIERNVQDAAGHLEIEYAAIVLRSTRSSANSGFLRLPLLMPNQRSRDKALAASARRDLGMSAMYRDILPHLAGVPERVARQDGFPAASDFAQRLITLPIQKHVTMAAVQALEMELLAAGKPHRNGR